MFQVWDNTLTQQIAAYEQLVYMEFVPQTGHLVSLSLLGNLQILRHDPKRHTFETVSNFNISSICFKSIPKTMKPLYVSPNGEVAAVIGCDEDIHDHGTFLLQLWNIPRQEKIKEIKCYRINQMVISHESRYVVVVEYGGFARRTQLLGISNSTEVRGCDLHGGLIISFHPSGQIFGIVSEDQETISVWKGTPWVKHFVFQASRQFNVKALGF